jgi:hypothetical protein
MSLYIEAMQAKGIKVSKGAAKAFQNQVIESFDITFKASLKQKIAAKIKQQTGESLITATKVQKYLKNAK